jgi:hypothetical protein
VAATSPFAAAASLLQQYDAAAEQSVDTANAAVAAAPSLSVYAAACRSSVALLRLLLRVSQLARMVSLVLQPARTAAAQAASTGTGAGGPASKRPRHSAEEGAAAGAAASAAAPGVDSEDAAEEAALLAAIASRQLAMLQRVARLCCAAAAHDAAAPHPLTLHSQQAQAAPPGASAGAGSKAGAASKAGSKAAVAAAAAPKSGFTVVAGIGGNSHVAAAAGPVFLTPAQRERLEAHTATATSLALLHAQTLLRLGQPAAALSVCAEVAARYPREAAPALVHASLLHHLTALAARLSLPALASTPGSAGAASEALGVDASSTVDGQQLVGCLQTLPTASGVLEAALARVPASGSGYLHAALLQAAYAFPQQQAAAAGTSSPLAAAAAVAQAHVVACRRMQPLLARALAAPLSAPLATSLRLQTIAATHALPQELLALVLRLPRRLLVATADAGRAALTAVPPPSLLADLCSSHAVATGAAPPAAWVNALRRDVAYASTYRGLLQAVGTGAGASGANSSGACAAAVAPADATRIRRRFDTAVTFHGAASVDLWLLYHAFDRSALLGGARTASAAAAPAGSAGLAALQAKVARVSGSSSFGSAVTAAAGASGPASLSDLYSRAVRTLPAHLAAQFVETLTTRQGAALS